MRKKGASEEERCARAAGAQLGCGARTQHGNALGARVGGRARAWARPAVGGGSVAEEEAWGDAQFAPTLFFLSLPGGARRSGGEEDGHSPAPHSPERLHAAVPDQLQGSWRQARPPRARPAPAKKRQRAAPHPPTPRPRGRAACRNSQKNDDNAPRRRHCGPARHGCPVFWPWRGRRAGRTGPGRAKVGARVFFGRGW